MSDEQDKLKLSLEPPKLFGRKKKSDAVGTSKSTSPAPDADVPEEDSPELTDSTATAEAVAPTEPAEEPTEVLAPVEVEQPDEPVTSDERVAEATAPIPVVEDPADPVPAPEAAPEPAAKKVAPTKAAPKKPAPAKKSAPAKPAASVPTPAVDPADKPARPRAQMAPPIEPEPITTTDREDAEITLAAETPLLPFYPAAAVTGVVVGATMVLLTWLSLRGCEAIRGTSSCGGGPGFVLLVATFVLCILLGSTLLRVFSIPDPGSSSFLAVGLVAVVSLLFLVDVLDHWSMIIVIPIISIGAFLASVWVTKTFVEPDIGS